MLLVALPIMLLHQLAIPIAGQGRARLERKLMDDLEDLASESVMLQLCAEGRVLLSAPFIRTRYPGSTGTDAWRS